MDRTGMIFEVVHKRKVYDFYITPTDKKPALRRTVKTNFKEVRDLVKMEDCDICHSIIVMGICMNKDCPTNLK